MECQPVGISRGTPRGNPGFRYRVLRNLAPNNETWAQEDQDSFEASYRAQLESLGVERIMADLEYVSGSRPVVYLCWERPGDEYCHRWTLSRWLHEQTGIEIPELRAGMLRKRADAPQQALFDYREERG